MKTPELLQRIETWVSGWGVRSDDVELVAVSISLLTLILTALIANYVAKHFIMRAVTAFIRRTETQWDDKLIDRHVFTRVSQLVPGMLLFVAAPLVFVRWPILMSLSERAALVYMGVITLLAIDGVLNAMVDVYESVESSRFTPVKSYVQVVKIVTYVVGAILLVSAIIDRSPVVLLSGLGALSAVLLLVFKDSILGLVASVQLSAQDMVRKGDWIEVTKYGADGDVIDITLTTIKVQNWDKTISTIPAYSLISESFRNWRGMQEAGGRRIKRALSLDMNTVRFCTSQDLDRFARIALIRDYVEARRAEVEQHNVQHAIDATEIVNGRRMTNFGTFRAYVLAYLRAHPKIHQHLTLLVRQLSPGEGGIAIELYCFTNDTAWANYESIQADIFDHLLAVVPEFGLRVFQSPSGADFRGDY
jgi:miniconductance mechanosensitive channel